MRRFRVSRSTLNRAWGLTLCMLCAGLWLGGAPAWATQLEATVQASGDHASSSGYQLTLVVGESPIGRSSASTTILQLGFLSRLGLPGPTDEPPGPATLTITSPLPGAVVAGTTVTVVYHAAGTFDPGDHADFRLDGVLVHDVEFSGVVQWTQVAVGAHVLEGSLVDATETTIAGTEVSIGFTTREDEETDNQPPSVPQVLTPADGATGQPFGVVLSWTPVTDPDGDAVSYDVLFESQARSPQREIASDLVTTNLAVGPLDPDTTYVWQVIATDEQGEATEGAVWQFQTAAPASAGDTTPPVLLLAQPGEGEEFVPRDTNLLLQLTDTGGSGIDPASLFVSVDGLQIIAAGQTQAGVSAEVVAPSPDELVAVYDPATDLKRQATLEVSVQLQDRSGNLFSDTYAFTTMPLTFGSPKTLTSAVVADHPALVVSPDGEQVTVAWRELDPSTQQVRLVVSHSSDRGNHFSQAVSLDSQFSGDPFDIGAPQMTFEESEVSILWARLPRNPLAPAELWLAHSEDQGTSFAAPQLMSTTGEGSPSYALAAKANRVAVAWTDPTQAQGCALCVAESQDRAETFDPPVSAHDATSGAQPRSLSLQYARPTQLVIAWVADAGEPPTPTVWLDETDNKGHVGADIRVGAGALTPGSLQVEPGGKRRHLAIVDNGHVWLTTQDAGRLLAPVQALDSLTSAQAQEAVLAINPAKALVVCGVDRSPQAASATDTDIYCAESLDAGASFKTTVLASEGVVTPQAEAALAMDHSGELALVFADEPSSSAAFRAVVFTKSLVSVPVVQSPISNATGGMVEAGSDSALAGVRVEVPPNAMLADWTVTISQPEWVSREGLPPGISPVGPAVTLGPGGSRFLQAVTLCLPYDVPQLSGLGLEASTLQVYRLLEPMSTVQPMWEALPSAVHATEVCAPTEHFSIFGLGGGLVRAVVGGGGVGGVLGGLDGEGGGGCYVASSAFGSPQAPEVRTMMAVRSKYLEPHPLGRRLVAFYEDIGPRLARVLEAHPWFKGPVRSMLIPVVRLCHALMRKPESR